MIQTHLQVLVSLLLLLPLASCTNHQSLASSDNSQSKTTQPSQSPSTALSRIISLNSISPYKLEEYINGHDISEEETVDFKPFWDKLQIPRDQEGSFDGFIPSSTRWHAEIINATSPQRDVGRLVLKIEAYGGADRRYLVFSNGGRQWQFSGYIDILGNYEGSQENQYHKIVSYPEGTWLILRAAPRIGTGISATDEIWYKIDEDHPREVLKYPIKGGRVMGNLSDLEYKASIGEAKFIDGRLRQSILYRISFGTEYKQKFQWLFSKAAQVHFVWDESSNKFEIDSSKSDISQEEIDTTFGSWDEEKFIKYNLQELVKLARGANAEQKKWLERVINEMPDGPQKSTLIEALK